MRITPVINDLVNEEWIHDKVRFSYDGLVYNRLGNPLKRVGISLVAVGWKDIILEMKSLFYNNLLGINKFHILFSNKESIEDIDFINKFSKLLGKSYLTSEYINSYYDFDFLVDYGLSIDLVNMDKFKYYILLGHNFKLESPIINLKIRRSVITNLAVVYYFGTSYNSNYNYYHKGLTKNKFFQ